MHVAIVVQPLDPQSRWRDFPASQPEIIRPEIAFPQLFVNLSLKGIIFYRKRVIRTHPICHGVGDCRSTFRVPAGFVWGV